jgi:ankyrin repeat protein
MIAPIVADPDKHVGSSSLSLPHPEKFGVQASACRIRSEQHPAELRTQRIGMVRHIRWEEDPDLNERWQEAQRLRAACENGDVAAATNILQARPALLPGPDFDYQFHYPEHAGWSPIGVAARRGQASLLRVLLDLGANPIPFEVGGRYHTDNFLDWLDLLREREQNEAANILAAAIQNRYGPFVDTENIHAAVRAPDIDRARALLDENPDRVRQIDAAANTPLHWAVDTGNLELVRLLVERKSPVDARRGDGRTPALIAIYGMHKYWRREDKPEILGYLLTQGAEYSCLIASATGNIDRVRECLRGDAASANNIDPIGLRPLSAAASGNHLEVLQTLLDAGANPNARELMYQGGGALHTAAWKSHLEAARLLLEAGARPDEWMDSCGTPIIIAGDNQPMTRLLYSYGATTEIAHYAAKYAIDTVAEILRRDPSLANEVLPGQWQQPWDKSDLAYDIISLAIRYGARFENAGGWKLGHLVLSYPDVAKLVFEHGGDPDVALMQLVSGFKTTTVDTLCFLLEECGASVNARREGFTALAAAAAGGKIEFVEYLLDRGAEINADVPDWQQPLRLAQSRGHIEIAQLLRQRKSALEDTDDSTR